jgi:hypothetical protein
MGGEGEWNSLRPTMRNALLTQYYNQGPSAYIKNALLANQSGDAYVPRIGTDGAGANYVANEGILGVAMTWPAYWIDPSKVAYLPADRVFPSYVPGFVPGPNPFNPSGQPNTVGAKVIGP